ncbi:hypothetical protein V8C37DRAFT_397291 [Trichoderma ceciliae]
MFILQSRDYPPSGALGRALSNIQKLAEQIICCAEDMEYLPDDSDLMRIPTDLLPKTSLELDLLLHNDKDVQTEISTFADKNGFIIDFGQLYLGPDIIWLQNGTWSVTENQTCFLIVLKRPESKGADVVYSTPVQEPPSYGIIERPIGHGPYVQSSFQCQVGDVIILEGGERLRIRKEGDVEPRSVCFLATLHQLRLKDHTNSQRMRDEDQ